jgi:hypothetical protein
MPMSSPHVDRKKETRCHEVYRSHVQHIAWRMGESNQTASMHFAGAEALAVSMTRQGKQRERSYLARRRPLHRLSVLCDVGDHGETHWLSSTVSCISRTREGHHVQDARLLSDEILANPSISVPSPPTRDWMPGTHGKQLDLLDRCQGSCLGRPLVISSVRHIKTALPLRRR